ncbi:MAG: hypothetical protein FWC50_14440 [Planctomycetaceae bacterium]|nr:hypothetical protein [Planctomycetaceae bacterium]
MSESSNILPTEPKALLPWLNPKNVVSSPTSKYKRVHVDPDQDRPILKCPVCGYEYNHLAAVEVRGRIGPLVGVGTRIDAAGTSVFHTPARLGFAVDLEFSGECGHDFIYTLEFYKGQILVSQREMPKHRSSGSYENTSKTIMDDEVW